MYIKSLDITIKGHKIITDVDDCLISSSKAIDRLGLSIKRFWRNEALYKSKKKKVFESAKLTKWGEEFKTLINNGFDNYILLTAANDRSEILKEKFGIDPDKLMEGCEDLDKIKFLDSIKESSIYIDDKNTVINQTKNHLITCKKYGDRRPKNMLIKC